MKKTLDFPLKTSKFKITEGFYYSDQEKAIHGLKLHGGIDYAVPRMTPVLAAADGFAYAAYQWAPLDNRKEYKGKTIGMGYGFYVRIYHPQFDSKKHGSMFTTYGHLTKPANKIVWHKPICENEKLFQSQAFRKKFKLLKNKRNATFVKKGEVIGYVGDSGLTWGYKDYPKRPNPKKFPSWDEVHLHFEVYTRKHPLEKKRHIDPYQISKKGSAYQSQKVRQQRHFVL